MSFIPVHILWGELAVSLYRRGVIDNTVRLAHAVYDFASPAEVNAFLLGIHESRRPHEWAHVTRLPDLRSLGLPLRSRLISAVLSGDLDEVERMLDSGVRCDTKAPNGMSALQLAAQQGLVAIASLLLKKGALPEEPADSLNPHSALHLAASSSKPGAKDVLVLLSEQNIDLDRVNREGQTALTQSLQAGRLDAATALLVHGARPDVTNADGKSPREIFATEYSASAQDSFISAFEQQLDKSEALRLANSQRSAAMARHAVLRPTPYNTNH